MRKYVDRPVVRTGLGAFVEDIPERPDARHLRDALRMPEDAIILLYLGRLDVAWKGLTTLIDAMALIRDAAPAD